MKKLISFIVIGCQTLTFAFAQTAAETTEVAQQTETKVKKEFHALEKGSFLQISGGAGHGALNYTMDNGVQKWMVPAATLNLNYSYFFLPYLGVGIGTGISTYGSTAILNKEFVWNGVSDSENDTYNHHTQVTDWTEKQLSHMVEVPLALQFHHNFGSKVGLFAALGAKIGIPVYSTYEVTSGTLTHSGYYPQWDLWLRDLPDRFFTEDNTGKNGKFNLKPSYSAFAEFGLLFQLGKRTDLLLGLYGSYGFNDISPVVQNDRSELGFRNNTYAFMNDYNGLIGTREVNKINTLNYGVKIGVQVYLGGSKKKPVEPEKVFVHDTIRIVDTLIIRDTVTNVEIKYIEKQAQQRLDKILQTAVIWFDFDKYDPKVEPADLLDNIADVLKSSPTMKISVNGHTCSIGSDKYNEKLSKKRADVIAKLLKEKGVANNQITVRAFASYQPFRYNAKEHQRSKDRRVEIIPLNEKGEMCDSLGNIIPEPIRYTKFMGKEKVSEGDRLAQYARKWYGEQAFWVYIYEANIDKIPHPNKLEKGITIKIPKLDAALIDPNNPASIDAANKIKAKYMQ